MSVQSHFPHPPDTRMPKNPGAVDELGIRYEGPVLSGQLGVREAFKDQAARLGARRESNLPKLGPGFRVRPMSPGPPVTDVYDSPDQYDPVLRFHLGMPPASQK